MFKRQMGAFPGDYGITTSSTNIVYANVRQGASLMTFFIETQLLESEEKCEPCLTFSLL